MKAATLSTVPTSKVSVVKTDSSKSIAQQPVKASHPQQQPKPDIPLLPVATPHAAPDHVDDTPEPIAAPEREVPVQPRQIEYQLLQVL